MAFGTLSGTLGVNAVSIANPFVATGSVVVAVGDLVVAALSQQTDLTATTCSDNLGNTYTAQNVGTDAGTATGKAWWSRVTVAGTLTSVSAVTTASTDNAAFMVGVWQGRFSSSPLDANPANLSNDTTTPFSCPTTGTLAQASELVVGWIGSSGSSTAFTATSPNLLAGQQISSTVATAVIGYQVVSATTAVAPAFATSVPSSNVLGTMSFKQDLTVASPSWGWQQPLAAAAAVALAFSTQPVGFAAPGPPAHPAGMAWYSDLARPLPPPKAQQATFFVPFNTPQVAAPTQTWGWQQQLQAAPVTTAVVRNTTSLTFIVPPFPVPSGWQSLQQSVAPPVAKAQQATVVLPFVQPAPVVATPYGWQQPLSTPAAVAQAQQTQPSGFAVPANPVSTIAGMAWYRDLAVPLPVAKAQQAFSFVPFDTPQIITNYIPIVQEYSIFAERPVYYKSFVDIFPPITAPTNTIQGMAWYQPLSVPLPAPKAQQASITLPLGTIPLAPWGWQNLQPSVAPRVAQAQQAYSFVSLNTAQITPAPSFGWFGPLSVAPKVAVAAQPPPTFIGAPPQQTAAIGGIPWFSPLMAVAPSVRLAQQAYFFVPFNTAQITPPAPTGLPHNLPFHATVGKLKSF